MTAHHKCERKHCVHCRIDGCQLVADLLFAIEINHRNHCKICNYVDKAKQNRKRSVVKVLTDEAKHGQNVNHTGRIRHSRVCGSHLLCKIEYAVVYAEVFSCNGERIGHLAAHSVHSEQNHKANCRRSEQNHAYDKGVALIPFRCKRGGFLLKDR